MARSKQYAERVNILKKVRVGGVWKLSAVLERNGKSSATTSSFLAPMNTILKGGTTWSGTGGKAKAPSGPNFADVIEAARHKSIEVNAQKAGIIEASGEPEGSVSRSVKPLTSISISLRLTARNEPTSPTATR